MGDGGKGWIEDAEVHQTRPCGGRDFRSRAEPYLAPRSRSSLRHERTNSAGVSGILLTCCSDYNALHDTARPQTPSPWLAACNK
jgi:hypothetical protein